MKTEWEELLEKVGWVKITREWSQAHRCNYRYGAYLNWQRPDGIKVPRKPNPTLDNIFKWVVPWLLKHGRTSNEPDYLVDIELQYQRLPREFKVNAVFEYSEYSVISADPTKALIAALHAAVGGK